MRRDLRREFTVVANECLRVGGREEGQILICNRRGALKRWGLLTTLP